MLPVSRVFEGRRDLAAAIEDTEFFISCMQSCEPAIWTLENSPAMFRHFEGQYPTAKLVQMREHAALPCERRRIILSNRSLYFPVEPSKVTPQDVLAADKGWTKAKVMQNRGKLTFIKKKSMRERQLLWTS